jgi:hypothetical protein
LNENEVFGTNTENLDTNELTSKERNIILGSNKHNVGGTTKEAILLKWHKIWGHVNPNTYLVLRS